MKMTKKTLGWISISALVAAASFGAGVAVAKSAAKMPELSLLKDATWTPLMKEGPLPAMSPISGDGMKGAYEGYLKLPAGFESPVHSHSNDYWAVLIQGKMTHWAANGGSEKDAKQLGVGDLTFMPAKVDHISKCYPGAECIMVVMQKGKFDFVPAKAPKVAEKPADKPADKAPAGDKKK